MASRGADKVLIFYISLINLLSSSIVSMETIHLAGKGLLSKTEWDSQNICRQEGDVMIDHSGSPSFSPVQD